MKVSKVSAAVSAEREADVVVVGAGVAGLSAAMQLRRGGVRDVVVLEASDGVGGRWEGWTTRMGDRSCPWFLSHELIAPFLPAMI